MSGTTQLRPTYHGYVRDTTDALIIFEACLAGQLLHVPRRPHDRERQNVIKSGSIFVYEEHASGIKRWTDSITWSPSRIMGNYLVYRQLEKPFAPGEKKRAKGKGGKSTTQSGGISKPRQRNALPFQQGLEHGNEYPSVPSDEDRQLVGSLVDSYDFKEQGLVKKTISITYNGVPHHLISYYTVEDVKAGLLTSPADDQGLRGVVPRAELTNGQNFRAPIEESIGGAYMPGMRHSAAPATDAPAADAPAADASATGTSAVGTSATSASAVGTSATSASAIGTSATSASAIRATATSASAIHAPATGAPKWLPAVL
ncbi:multidrug transporter [Fusarium musae]|uniref:Multidrug transporter n=1 Tax=Fusarium musae TaxID=1042133 RepID=A0A9P8DIC3_9HYPO|nr:multidrug transporter [Fusarium musae]KAG9502421.1 multidrug transporter [Fusarium musae]